MESHTNGHTTDPTPRTQVERADVVVVGSRVAGSASAIALARAGRKVIVLERGHFPSNTLSTHGFWPSGVAELAKVGALERVLELDPPRVHRMVIHHLAYTVDTPFTPVDGIDYGLCIPRPQLDEALAETSRAEGADVRERHQVVDLVRDGDRVVGVRWRRTDDRSVEGEIRAPLVIGADGRRSTVARLVGAETPYRGSRASRGFAYWYMDDPKVGTRWRDLAAFWRTGETIVLAGAMPQDRMIALAMCPSEEIPLYRKDPEGMWERLLRGNRHLADRVAGATRPTRLYTGENLTAFFRASSGPGWALAGDAGHFKDPGIAQGIRDALHFARRLGELAAPAIGDPRRLDAALRGWERERDRECLSTYHWANREGRVDPSQPLLLEGLQTFAREGRVEFMDVMVRERDYEDVATPGRGALWLARALARPEADRRMILEQAQREFRISRDVGIEKALNRFRPTRPHASEVPGWEWPPGRSAAATREDDLAAAERAEVAA